MFDNVRIGYESEGPGIGLQTVFVTLTETSFDLNSIKTQKDLMELRRQAGSVRRVYVTSVRMPQPEFLQWLDSASWLDEWILEIPLEQFSQVSFSTPNKGTYFLRTERYRGGISKNFPGFIKVQWWPRSVVRDEIASCANRFVEDGFEVLLVVEGSLAYLAGRCLSELTAQLKEILPLLDPKVRVIVPQHHLLELP
jgi:hypothetical protein